ncbi:MAG: hypothetical protein LBD57_05945 [Endomicrobium sp.]|jgi:hypothetical protein|uniref:hypothetical protein n=1 Tax=Candidatus Endomicrobiellum cubanum TaxID=3242325 RepID=UPI002825DD58|nr:hypothetical protein [Endomicrobium sp.]
MALINKFFVVVYKLLLIVLFVPYITSASDFGEININLGANLLSRATLLDEKNFPSGYQPDGLTSLKNLSDTSLTDDFWKQRYICSFGFEYMHNLNFINKKLKNIKFGVGTKLIQRSIRAMYGILEEPTPNGDPFEGGGVYIIGVDPGSDELLSKAYRELYMLPLYLAIQTNPIESGSLSGIYLKGNVGYNFILKDDLLGVAKYYTNSSLWEYKREGGLYLGAELGNEFEFSKKCAIILSVYYDYVQYTSVLTDVGKYHGPLEHARLTNVDHSIGLKTGLKFKI